MKPYSIIVHTKTGTGYELDQSSEADAVHAARMLIRHRRIVGRDVRSVQISGPRGWVRGWGPGQHELRARGRRRRRAKRSGK